MAACYLDRVCRQWSNCNTACGLSNLPCQIRCADLYKPTDASADKIIEFSECVISQNHCAPQSKIKCPVPARAGLEKALDLQLLTGTWYVTRGFNPTFDCFDCQVHSFVLSSSDDKPLHGSLKYSVKTDLSCRVPSCHYLQREVFQSFAQDPQLPGHLINHNNTAAELHYADDWYVLAAKADSYALVYYCGCNDASCGYSGAVLYTRASDLESMAAAEVDAVRAAVTRAGIPGFTLDAMCRPDNRACSESSGSSGATAMDLISV